MEAFQVERVNGARALRLVGELDMQTAPLLREALEALPGTGVAELDLSDITFIDSSGLHVFAEFAGSDGHRLVLRGVSDFVLRVFEVTRLVEHPGIEMRVGVNGR